ncbi:MAG TPA: TetR family transcriptional regulator [Ilumatobacteraceae bacterium]
MPMGRLRDRHRVETRSLILEAALDLMEANGFEQTTVEDIAAAAGVSSRTFFRYFESKNAVLIEGPSDEEDHGKGDEMMAALVARPASETMSEALGAVLHDKLGQLFEAEDGCKLRQLRIILAEPVLRVMARDNFHEHRPMLAAAFAARLGVDPDALAPRVLSAAFTEAIWVILEKWAGTDGDPAELPGLIDEAFSTLNTALT